MHAMGQRVLLVGDYKERLTRKGDGRKTAPATMAMPSPSSHGCWTTGPRGDYCHDESRPRGRVDGRAKLD